MMNKFKVIFLFSYFLLVFLFVMSLIHQKSGNMHQNVREAMFSGSWYPADREILAKLIDKYEIGNKSISNIRALIVPHAAYIYSGDIAGKGYSLIDDHYKRVFLLATNHAEVYYKGWSVGLYDYYETPLGKVKVSSIAKELIKNPLFQNIPKAHSTHIIELQLPFLQRKIKNFEIIPLISGYLDDKMINETAEILEKYIDNNTLIVVSSDLSHYHNYEDAQRKDKRCIKAIENKDYEEIKKCEACGIYAILTLERIAIDKGWNVKVLAYKNSGDVNKQYSSVVGYSAIVFTGNAPTYNKRVREVLRSLAYNSIKKGLGREAKEINSNAFKELDDEKKGCFVTIKKKGELRGCIGTIKPIYSLKDCVVKNAYNAAFRDPRFEPLRSEELKDIEIEISVLTEPQKLEYKDAEDLLNKINKGMGVIIKKGFREATFLPQVWEEIPDKQEFLEQLCRKASLPSNCWRDAEVYVYKAFVL